MATDVADPSVSLAGPGGSRLGCGRVVGVMVPLPCDFREVGHQRVSVVDFLPRAERAALGFLCSAGRDDSLPLVAAIFFTHPPDLGPRAFAYIGRGRFTIFRGMPLVHQVWVRHAEPVEI